MVLIRAVLRAFACLYALVLCLACCTSTPIMQSGIVPFAEPEPPPTSHGTGEVSLSASGLSEVHDTAPSTSGAYVSTAQVRLAGSIRPIGGLMIRPSGMLALPGQDALALRPGAIAAPTRPSGTIGVDVGYMLGDEREPWLFRPHVGVSYLGIAVDLAVPTGSSPQHSGASMAVIEGGLDLGYWVLPWLLVLGSVDLRNTPTIASAGVVSSCDVFRPPFVDFGGLTVSSRLSVEVELGDVVSLYASVTIPTYGSPYLSYPIVGGGLRARFGDASVGMFGHPRNVRAPTEPRTTGQR